MPPSRNVQIDAMNPYLSCRDGVEPVIRHDLQHRTRRPAPRGDEARSVLAHGEPLDPAFLDQPWAVYGLRGIDPERLVDGLRKAGWEG